MSRTILITGATGRQGSALIDALLATPGAAPFHILALTRTPNSPAAQGLLAKSSTIELVAGDLDNPEPIFTTPIWGVFSVQLGVAPGMTPARERAQGIALIDTAVAHGVKHFVYASADLGSPPRPTFVPQFQTKYAIEQHLFASGLSWTVLRPVVFFENLTPDIVGQTFAGALKYYIAPTREVQFIATADIGWFAAQAFLKPDEWRGRVVGLAGDSMDFATFQRVFRETTGRELPLPWGWWFLPWLVFHVILRDLGVMYKWFDEEGFGVDVEECRGLYPRLTDYRAWLERSPFVKEKST